MIYTSSTYTTTNPEKIFTLIVEDSDFSIKQLLNCINLENLQIKGVDWSSLDLSLLHHLSKITSVTLINNKHLEQISLPSQPISSITTFQSINNALKSLPKNIVSLKNIQYLNFERNNLQSSLLPLFPKFLNLAANKINTLEQIILKNPNLENLNLSFNNITNFHLEASSYKLTQLLLTDNKLQSFHYHASENKIDTLFLSNNLLSKVPSCLQNFTSLEHLDLSNNISISLLPDWLRTLPYLKEIQLNGLNQLSLQHSLIALSNIEILELSFCDFDEFPEVLTEITTLKDLSINFSLIEEVPKSINQLINLEYLELKSNDLESLPPEIYTLPKLKKIDLQYNNFSPDTITKIIKRFEENRIICLL